MNRTDLDPQPDFIDRFEGQLLSARRPRRLRLPRRAAIGLVGLTLVSGTAVAAIAPWNPNLGPGHERQFDISASEAPAAQRNVLAVLRRDQTPSDRGEPATYALRFFGSSVRGVRTDSVRVLRGNETTNSTVLVPVAVYQDAQDRSRARDEKPPSEKDGLCLFVRDPVDGGWQGCFSLEQLRSGDIRGALSNGSSATLVGLVPDTVSSVRLRISGRLPVVTSVRENLYEVRLDALPAADATRELDWLDSKGEVVLTQEALVPPASSPDEAYITCDDGVTLPFNVKDDDPEEICRAHARGR